MNIGSSSLFLDSDPKVDVLTLSPDDLLKRLFEKYDKNNDGRLNRL